MAAHDSNAERVRASRRKITVSQIAFFPLLIPLTNTFFLNRPYGVIVDEGSSSVAWYVGVHAKYFTPMDFHRFPFDTQVLDMQFSFEAGEFHNKFIVLYCTDPLPFSGPKKSILLFGGLYPPRAARDF